MMREAVLLLFLLVVTAVAAETKVVIASAAPTDLIVTSAPQEFENEQPITLGSKIREVWDSFLLGKLLTI
jgi:hypothetical protein